MFSKELEEIIEAALADGVLTDKERAVLHKRALAEGVDLGGWRIAQKKETIKAIKDYCTTPARKSVWKSLKESAGFDGKLEDMPLDLMKELYRKLTEE